MKYAEAYAMYLIIACAIAYFMPFIYNWAWKKVTGSEYDVDVLALLLVVIATITTLAAVAAVLIEPTVAQIIMIIAVDVSSLYCAILGLSFYKKTTPQHPA
jgi:predicted PurR-regulated permease PerM